MRFSSESRDYQAWIDDYVRKHYDPENELTRGLAGKCLRASVGIRMAFPELRLVSGIVRFNQVLPDGSRPEGWSSHWWCADPDGQIVDPTARQFERFEDLRYIEGEDGVEEDDDSDSHP